MGAARRMLVPPRARERHDQMRRIWQEQISKRRRVVGDLHDLCARAQRQLVHHLAEVPPNQPVPFAATLGELQRAIAQYLPDHAGYEWLRSPTYGTCEGCGAPIPLARLRAKPLQRFCPRCESTNPGGHHGG